MEIYLNTKINTRIKFLCDNTSQLGKRTRTFSLKMTYMCCPSPKEFDMLKPITIQYCIDNNNKKNNKQRRTATVRQVK